LVRLLIFIPQARAGAFYFAVLMFLVIALTPAVKLGAIVASLFFFIVLFPRL
jgi:hypothetical protein